LGSGWSPGFAPPPSPRPQRYGSQFTWVAHRWTLYALDDAAHVEARRKALGMSETEAQATARIAT
jgi:hypothetical protein